MLCQDLPMCDEIGRLQIAQVIANTAMRNPSLIPLVLAGPQAPFVTVLETLLESKHEHERTQAFACWSALARRAVGWDFFMDTCPRATAVVTEALDTSSVYIVKGAMLAWAVLLEEGDALTEAARTHLRLQVIPRVAKQLSAKPFKEVRPATWSLLGLICRV